MRGLVNLVSTNPVTSPSKNKNMPCQINLRLLSSMSCLRSCLCEKQRGLYTAFAVIGRIVATPREHTVYMGNRATILYLETACDSARLTCRRKFNSKYARSFIFGNLASYAKWFPRQGTITLIQLF